MTRRNKRNTPATIPTPTLPTNPTLIYLSKNRKNETLTIHLSLLREAHRVMSFSGTKDIPAISNVLSQIQQELDRWG
jgi:hypothetical protein